MTKILCLFNCPPREGNVLSGGTGLEFVRLINELGLTVEQDLEIRTILPTNRYLDPLLDVKKKDPAGVSINGHRVHQTIVAGIKQFLSTLPRDPQRLIIGFGELPLFTFHGELSITNFRGSMIQTPWGKFIPTLSVQSFVRVWTWRFLVKQDMVRALKYRTNPFPNYTPTYHLNPTYDEVMFFLDKLITSLDENEKPMHIACDIETFRRKEISVLGLAISEKECLPIPFLDFTKPNYSRWTIEQECQIVFKLKIILEHPHAEVSGQNFHYDVNYIIKQWGIYPRYTYDSMHMFHCLYPGELPKDLATLSSLFCHYHMYWKDEGKEIHDAIKTFEDQMGYWKYNAKDCCATWEIVEALRILLPATGLQSVWEFQQSMFPVLLKPMLRGCRYDSEQQIKWRFQFLELRSHYTALFERLVPSHEYFPRAKKGSSPWYDSPTKTKELLYDILKMEVQLDKKTKRPTTSDDALQILMAKEPILRPLLTKLLEYRSLGVFVSTFLSPSPDKSDKRMRTFYNLSGAATYRLSSKEDCFGTGQNLQNVPKGDK